jgi:hypothetical protein
MRGAWEPWLEFFLDGVAETANQTSSSGPATPKHHGPAA